MPTYTGAFAMISTRWTSPHAHMKHFLEQPAMKHVRHLFGPASSSTSSRANMSWALFDAKRPED